MFEMIPSSVVSASVLNMRLMVRPSENGRKMVVVNANQLMPSASSCDEMQTMTGGFQLFS